MKLKWILNQCRYRQLLGSDQAEVTGLRCDSRAVSHGDAFFAIAGGTVDGHDYVSEAVAAGASVVFIERLIECGPEVTRVLVDDCRVAVACVAQAFYDDPTQGWPVVGVTGTNGKTTITYLVESILQKSGQRPAVVGTINCRFGSQCLPVAHTTPDPLWLMETLCRFRRDGARSLVMEVSSHALDQHRVDGIHFGVGVFTNLTPEHLDYHRDMDHYFRSKSRLFHELLSVGPGQKVINIDDPYGRRLAELCPEVLTCSCRAPASIWFRQLELSLSGIRGRVATPAGEVDVVSRLLGDYNAENLLCAIGAGVALGLAPTVISQGIAELEGVPGRLQSVANNREAVILVDYAHTGDALRRVLETVQQLGPGRILTVFGCGGDRDAGKRPVMAEAAARLSTLAIATSDNPRSEDPQAILEDVRRGLEQVHPRELSLREARDGDDRGYVVIPDRREAIRFAVSLLRPNDLLLVAGKGHEDYQILASGRIHFDDREELRLALAAGEI